MLSFGYALSSEEHRPKDLVRNARLAEQAGFEFALISDHYHPWVDRQGHSPFVWSVLGGIAEATQRIRLGTGVTCPIIRIHPAIIAQAAATVASMLPGRFFLGLGTGENLNEHVLGDRWPEPSVRLEMLEEAVDVIRRLWSGEVTSHRGEYYTVDEARIYTLPDGLPPILLAADGEKAAELGGEIGDGLIGVAPKPELIESFENAGGAGKPCYGQITVCWAASLEEAQRTAHEFWPTSGLRGNLNWGVKTPKLFEQAVKTVRQEDVAESIVCGPDVGRYVQQVRAFVEAGFDYVYFHQVGPDQDGFIDFFAGALRPKISALGWSGAA
jgi:G6PDH family F420-dependent oxidoreductase